MRSKTNQVKKRSIANNDQSKHKRKATSQNRTFDESIYES